jgi:glyoxylase-like metal-dependent hydrolase (beta-lactamase superfamily II)
MKIAPGVYQVGATRRGYFKAGYTKAFVVDHEEGLIIIDTHYDADANLILDEIAGIGRKPEDIRHILLTHAHRGHMGGMATLKQVSGASIYAHEWEADIISGNRAVQGVDIFNTSPIQTWPIIFFGQLTARWNKHAGHPVDQLIDEGDKIGPLEVIHTPGHTPGHLIFFWPERKVLFTGDAFVTWPLITPGWRNSMLNVPQSWQSLERMASLDVEVIGPGHGDAITSNGAAVLQALVKKGKV